MEREFIESHGVRDTLKDNGVSDEQVRDMEIAIMFGGGTTIARTSGLKKIRCGAQGRGKRGGVRIVFADYPQAGKTFLVAALGKTDREDFTNREYRELRKLKRMLDKTVRR